MASLKVDNRFVTIVLHRGVLKYLEIVSTQKLLMMISCIVELHNQSSGLIEFTFCTLN